MQDPAPEQDSNKGESEIQLSRPVPPTLLRIYADNQDKRTLCIFWAIFFVIIIIITGVSFGLPSQVIYYSNKVQLKGSNLKDCATPATFSASKELACYEGSDRQGVMLTDLSRENQFAVIFLNFMLKSTKDEFKEVTYDTKVRLHELDVKGKEPNIVFKDVRKVETKDWFEQTLYPRDAIKIYGEDEETIIGYRYPLFGFRNFKEQSYVLIIETSPDLVNITNADKIEPEIMVVNEKFTAFSIAIRYVFFVCSMIGLLVYGARFKKIPKSERILEQKMIMALSVLLIMFNDPLYPVTILYPNKASSYFSVFFVINFIIYLLFLWIIFLDRIYYEDGKKDTELFNYKRIIYIIFTYIFTLVLYTEFAMDHIQGLPIVATQDLHTYKFLALEVIVLILVMLGFVYILVQYIRICVKVDSKMWRNQLFMFFSLFFLFVSLVMFFLDGYSINDMAGNRILLLFTIMNMYTFYLQYMYSITTEEREKVERGQIYGDVQRPGGFGLLENGSDGADFVDLEFKDIVPPGGLHFKKDSEDNHKGWGYQMDMKEMQKEQLEQVESDKPDFFNERQQEQDDNKKKNRNKEDRDFDQFSLE